MRRFSILRASALLVALVGSVPVATSPTSAASTSDTPDAARTATATSTGDTARDDGALEPQATNVGFESITPVRLLDTRAGEPTIDGAFSGDGALGDGAQFDLTVAARGGVPATGITTVVLNVTVDQPTTAGFVTVWPTGAERPNTSNLNFIAGQTVPNLVVAKVGTGGRVSLYNLAGQTHLIVDVVAFAREDAITSLTPARVLDTRPGGVTTDGAHAGEGALGAAGERALSVLGRGGIPANGVAAVILNITATEPTDNGYLTVWPNGEGRPTASNLNFDPGQSVPNLVVAKVSAGGAIGLFNSRGTTHVVADVVGYFATSSQFTALSPARLLDTRPGQPTIDGLAAGVGALSDAAALRVSGRGGVPTSGAGTVILNVTVTEPDAAGYVTVWPSDEDRPTASNLNFRPGQTIANLVAARLGSDGRIDLFNFAGNTHLIVDIVGWLPAVDRLGHTTFVLPPGVVGRPFVHDVGVRGGDAPYTWSATATQPGLSIETSTGLLVGTPTQPGTVSTHLSVRDAFNRQGTRAVGHTVFPANVGYHPMTPTTVFRLDRPPGGASSTFQVAGTAGVPIDAKAVVLSVLTASIQSAAVALTRSGAVYAAQPTVTTSGGVDVTLVVVAPGSGGAVDLRTFGELLAVEVAISGYFDATAALEPTAFPIDLFNSWTSGQPLIAGVPRIVNALAPPDATYALMSVVAVSEPMGPGTITAWAGPTAPALPTIAWPDGQGLKTQFALVPLVNGSFVLRSDSSASLVGVNALGYLRVPTP